MYWIVLAILKKCFVKSKHKWSIDKLIDSDMDYFVKHGGKAFDIYNPVLFTQKIQWYKLFYDNKVLPQILDKVLFKDYVREKLGEGYTVPLIGAWDNIKDFKEAWSSLPEEFCLKSNIQGEGQFIKFIHKKSETSLNELCRDVRKWLNPKRTLKNSYCRGYYRTTAKIFAEEYMQQFRDQLYDYKMFCFSGKPYCMYVASEHFDRNDYPISFYDLDWNLMDVQYAIHKRGEYEKPVHFDEMISISEKLSADFPFVRVDFFDTGDKLYVAELTFYPGGGFSQFNPVEFDKKLGDMFELPYEDSVLNNR